LQIGYEGITYMGSFRCYKSTKGIQIEAEITNRSREIKISAGITNQGKRD